MWKVLNLQHIKAAVISKHAQGSGSLEIGEAWHFGATAPWEHTWQCSAWAFYYFLMEIYFLINRD